MVVFALNVAEKPSVAKSISTILSRGSFRTSNGYSPYNKIFEFNYMIGAQPCVMLMTSVTGHLMEIDFEGRFKKWHSCDPEVLFDAPVQKYVPPGKSSLERTLEEQARRCQWLVLWLDCDREGENIAFEVMEVCLRSNRQLNVFRAHFSALIDREIHHAAQHLGRPNPLFSDAVDARQEIDLRTGASFTRFQTLLLKDRFVFPYDEENLILSYGPCQFPTLGFVVERYWQVQAHEPENFWTIKCVYRSSEESATFNWARGHLFDYLAAAVIYEMCVEEPTATVYSVTGHETRKNPPFPLNTVELQKRASRFFRLAAEHTMKIAEELYQQGFISYPRTETDFFSENMDLMRLVEDQTRHPAWGTYAHRLLDPQENLWKHPGNGGHDDKAHPPIHPTRFSEGEASWTNDHKTLYEFVVRHFLACVSQPAVGYGTKAMIDIAGEQFSASGLMITARNYLDVYKYEKWSGSTLPNFEVGQQFVPTQLSLDMGTTQPPTLLSEAELIGLMDQAGIGTDATMHDHIKKLLDRHYATKDQNTRFKPTSLGEALIIGYAEMGHELWRPFLRAETERDMRAVSEGFQDKAGVLRKNLDDMRRCFVDAKLNKQKLIESMALFFERKQAQVEEAAEAGGIVRRCPGCHEAEMVLKKLPGGRFMVGCLNYPQCRSVVWLPGALVEATVTSELCASCGPGAVYRISFKFRRGEIPPQYSTSHIGCIGGCDPVLIDIIDACGTGGGPVPNRNRPPAPSYPGGARSGQAAGQGVGSRQPTQAPQYPGRQGGQGRRSENSRDAFGQGSPPSDAVQCACRQPCVLLTANTAANRGRRFYGCQTRTCGHFAWEDEAPNPARRPQNTAQPQRRGRGQRSRGSGRRNQGRLIAQATGEVFYDASPDF